MGVVGRPSAQDYLNALAQLDADLQAGRVTPAQYEFHKQRMIAESKPKSLAVRFLTVVAVIAVLWVIMRVLVVALGMG